jgi:hypothetical protein
MSNPFSTTNYFPKEGIFKVVSRYGFKEIPCSIPKNNFQYLKRYFYFKVHSISPKLFYFLRDKVSPIKFLDERPDGSLFYSIKENGKTIHELCIEKHPFYGTSISIGGTSSTGIGDGIVSDEEFLNVLDKFIQTIPDLKSRKRSLLLNQIC